MISKKMGSFLDFRDKTIELNLGSKPNKTILAKFVICYQN